MIDIGHVDRVAHALTCDDEDHHVIDTAPPAHRERTRAGP